MPLPSRRFLHQVLPSAWSRLNNLKKTNNPNVVEVKRGEVLDIYRKDLSGKVWKSVEHRFASVPEQEISIKQLPLSVQKKLGINRQ